MSRGLESQYCSDTTYSSEHESKRQRKHVGTTAYMMLVQMLCPIGLELPNRLLMSKNLVIARAIFRLRNLFIPFIHASIPMEDFP